MAPNILSESSRFQVGVHDSQNDKFDPERLLNSAQLHCLSLLADLNPTNPSLQGPKAELHTLSRELGTPAARPSLLHTFHGWSLPGVFAQPLRASWVRLKVRREIDNDHCCRRWTSPSMESRMVTSGKHPGPQQRAEIYDSGVS